MRIIKRGAKKLLWLFGLIYLPLVVFAIYVISEDVDLDEAWRDGWAEWKEICS